MSDEEDCWDAFGSDSDEDSDGEEETMEAGIEASDGMDATVASSIAMHLSQKFLKHNPQVKLSDRIVAVVCVGAENTDNCPISKHLEQRQMRVVSQSIPEKSVTSLSKYFGDLDTRVDALIVLDNSEDNEKLIRELVESFLCPGGVFITTSECVENTNDSMKELLDSPNPTIFDGNSSSWIALRKKTICAHASTCPWLSSSHSLAAEEERLHLATVALSSHEMASSPFSSQKTRRSSKLTEHSIKKAVANMKDYGYCILPGLLDTNECLEWGSVVLDCVHEASKILLERDGVNIYNPQSSTSEPQSYRELSMREDLRMDLRHGPALSKLRACKEGSAEEGGKSILLSSDDKSYGDGLFLRGHPSLLEVIRRTMNPGSSSFENHHSTNTKPLYLGNIGRWNFGGTGNNGSYQNLRISPIGGIVSLPGSAEQALHADTPHLFEHIPDLPAHYINVFAPCTPFEEKVGGTAFIHGSHDLSFTAKHYEADGNASFYPFLVRPKLTVGDVILFDCRILHFGLANTSASTERCICYVNTWHDWFHDAKNWDKNRAIFEDEGEEEK